ncbi:hypothetical protein CVT26_010205 [Gymnopilus dilepis]|uniref:Uncharacterized protein n=1 Tax=Gymnopilus dilepis TaxID=231916 RepID=A0A409W4M9_9AGAR|nr:hypothetical protein CVT26_010205 [Gymnopilus dilepis]
MSTNWYPHFQDNNEIKDVYIQAAGKKDAASSGDLMANLFQVNWNTNSRHAFIYWINGTIATRNPPDRVRQVVQLEQANNAGYFYQPFPIAKPMGQGTASQNDQYYLGKLTRQQRDRVLFLAQRVPFNPHSRTNGCRVWLRDLLQLMVIEGIIAQQVFDHVCRDIPLPERKPEA